MAIVLIVVLVVIVLGLVLAFNGLVRRRTRTQEAWSQIDVELKRRHDLIPNLVETVKGYAAHEQGTFEAVTNARAAAVAAGATGDPARIGAAENALSGTLRSLFAVAENYPQLKANQNFLELQGELSNTEDRIQAARRFYNANVQVYNARVKQFPSNVIAGMFGFKEEQFFEIPEAQRAVVAEAPHVDFGSAEAASSVPAPSAVPPAAPPAPPVADAPPAASPVAPPTAAGPGLRCS